MSISLKDVHFRYPKGPQILQGVTFNITSGETVAIVGPSGSGKTTLLNLIGGLLKPQQGTITTRTRPAWVFQTPTVFGRRSAMENVAVGLLSAGVYGKASRQAVRSLMTRLGLEGLEHRRANSLSGGELQRIAVARSLIGMPSLILADEPTGELDRATTLIVVQTMLEIRDPEAVVIFATHDDDVARSCGRRINVSDGQAIEMT